MACFGMFWKEFLLYPSVIQLSHFIAHTEWRKPLLSPREVQKKLFPGMFLEP